MAQVLCQKLSFFTFHDKQMSRRGQEKKFAVVRWIHKRGDQLLSAEVFHSESAPPHVGRSKVSWLV